MSFLRLMLLSSTVLATLIGYQSEVLAIGPTASKAVCSPGDRMEGGLQGQTTIEERFASDSYRSYNCNLELVGQHVGEGTGKGFAITGRCAYVSQWQAPPQLQQVVKDPGLMVIDVIDSANPVVTRRLKTPAMMHPDQLPLLHEGRKLLIAQNFDEFHMFGKTVDIYDISDCLNPVLKFSGIIPGYVLHDGSFNPDGTIVWATTGPVLRERFPEEGDTISALDVKDPANPKVIAKWRTDDPRLKRFHGLSVSNDGNTAYITIGEHSYSKVDGEVIPAPYQGIALLDISEVQAGKADPKITMIGEPFFWDDVVHTQYVVPFSVKGHKYLWDNRIDGVIATDAKVHTGFEYKRPYETPEAACAKGKPAWGYIGIINIDSPEIPSLESAIRLEVHDPKNCLATAIDPVFGHGYAPLNCDIDNPKDAKLMVCSFSEAGVRVFDIRDIKRPREIAYYKPPAVGAAPRAASPYQTFRDIESVSSVATKYHSADSSSNARFAKGGKEIWFSSYDNGFQVVRFSDELLEREKELFKDVD